MINDNKIILIGPSCCGKDFLRKEMQKRGYQYCVTHTTRAPRDGEKEGVDYFFIDKDNFKSMIKNKDFIEYDEFNNNYYGTLRENFENNDLFIMTPRGVNQLSEEYRKRCTVVYLSIDKELQKRRMKEDRGMGDNEIERRVESDYYTFLQFEDYDLYISNFQVKDVNKIINSIQK